MSRLKEGSTWAGIAAFLAAMASAFPHPYVIAASGVAGVVAGLIPDKGAAK